MGFGEDLKLFAENLDNRLKEVFLQTTIEVHDSITEGSAVTGAPGQPVDTGFLKDSWNPELLSELLWQDSTPASYAPIIEEGLREAYDPKGVDRPKEWEQRRQGGTNYKGPSVVGGHHSVAMTRAAWQRIVDYAKEGVVPNG